MSKPFKLFATYAKIIPVLSHIICLLCFIIMNIDVLIIHIKKYLEKLIILGISK